MSRHTKLGGFFAHWSGLHSDIRLAHESQYECWSNIQKPALQVWALLVYSYLYLGTLGRYHMLGVRVQLRRRHLVEFHTDT